MVNVLVAAFLVAHAAIHLAFVAPRPPATASGPPWPFDLTSSRILAPIGVPTDTARFVGAALVAITVLSFAVGALCVLGLAPGELLAASVVIGAAASIALLGAFFHPWLVLGIAIDMVLIWAVTSASWQPA